MSELQTREQMLFGLEREAYLRALAQARADGYAEGVEAAAKWHDEQHAKLKPLHAHLACHDEHAAAIRTLTAPSGKEGG